LWDGTDGVGMANTPSRDRTPNRTSADTAPISVLTDPAASVDSRLSPHVEALRKLVAAGQYQVSPRYLAHKIMRAAGFRPE
jgi:anti-sigma28 factor (negative regulator of flagellin synthesis)